MAYDFDRILDRRNTSSLKWDYPKRFTGQEDLLPFWVADMDFQAPREVIEALRRRVDHGVFGYTLEPESYFSAVGEWMWKRHGWTVRREWMLPAEGVVPAIDLAILAYTRPGDKVIIQPPVYYPFRSSIINNGRQVADNPLRLAGNRYEMDYEQLERLMDARTRLLILCSPHNPVGRVWSRGELAELADICGRNGVIIVSDEIHHDLIMRGHLHVPTALLADDSASITVTLTAASKTFNLAGAGCSMAIIPSRELRNRFLVVKESLWTGLANAFSVAATEAAYRHGESWLEQLLDYLQGNYELLISRLAARLPAVRAMPLEGTYLAWLDMRGFGLTDEELKSRLLRKARVWLNDGQRFGKGGEGFQRLNLACPRSVLAEGLERIVRAFDS